MIDNHDDSDEIDLPVLPAFARLHPNDHPLAVDRGRLQGDPARLQRPSIQRLRVGVAADGDLLCGLPKTGGFPGGWVLGFLGWHWDHLNGGGHVEIV